MLMSNEWSLEPGSAAHSYKRFLCSRSWTTSRTALASINSVPIVTANWEADSGYQWTMVLAGAVSPVRSQPQPMRPWVEQSKPGDDFAGAL